MITCTRAIENIVLALDVPKTLNELTRSLGRTPFALRRAISGGYVNRLSTDPILYVQGPRAYAIKPIIRQVQRNAGQPRPVIHEGPVKMHTQFMHSHNNFREI